VFGQPRQDDLLEWLLEGRTQEELASASEALRVDLAPSMRRAGVPDGQILRPGDPTLQNARGSVMRRWACAVLLVAQAEQTTKLTRAVEDADDVDEVG
jgi:hypothetical protein